MTSMCPMTTVSDQPPLPLPSLGESYHGGPEEDGFTLMEVMVSMAIIAIVLVSLFRIQSGSLDLAGTSRFWNTALFLAQRQLAVIEKTPVEQMPDSGEFDEPYQSFTWTCTQSETEDFDEELIPDNTSGRLMKIELDISQESSGRTYHVETFRFADAD